MAVYHFSYFKRVGIIQFIHSPMETPERPQGSPIDPESFVEEGFSPTHVFDWTVEYAPDSGQYVTVDRESRRVIVRKKEGATPAHLRHVGVFAAMREVALLESLQGTSPREALKLFSEDKRFVQELLRLSGARLLRDREPALAREMSDVIPPSDSATAEFKAACALYLATGAFPPATEAVEAELRNLPLSQETGEHILSVLTSERVTLSRKKKYFDHLLGPALDRLRAVDADLQASTSETFQPSTDDSAEQGEMDESEIMQRVLPFIGGYFRERVMDGVDWETMRVVGTGVGSEKLLPPEAEREIGIEAKMHTFHGRNGTDLSSGALNTPLPAGAEVFPETVTPGLSVRRSINGIHSLEWSGKGEPPDEYEFQFQMESTPRAWQNQEPTEAESYIPSWVVDTLSSETRTFLDELRGSRITNRARVAQIARRTQKSIEYVNDTSVGMRLAESGTAYFSTLEKILKGDCDVSNFYALAQIRSVGIPCRMVTGYHVRRDKRFPFAALAGTKHAWLEWWDKDRNLWERVDATSPKRDEDEEQKDEEEGGGGEDRRMNVRDEEDAASAPEPSDEDPFGLPLSDEDLQKLQETIAKLPEPGEALAKEAARLFEETYGISRADWDRVRTLAESVGTQKLPREVTIDKRAGSTVAEQWKHIFDLLLIAYKLPAQSREMIGRQSQGGDLVDPASAGIDVITGAEDPHGFRRQRKRERTVNLPIKFSNDFLLDVTASMQALNRKGKSLLQLEREFVLSSLYEGYLLNERLKQRSVDLIRTPLILNHVLSIHGDTRWREIVKNAPIELKELAMIDHALSKPTPGAGAMADAVEQYLRTLEADAPTLRALKQGEMVKTLTILTDGNLWCSSCGEESCTYELHGPAYARVSAAMKKIREFGIIVNAIGFTEQSRPVTTLFHVPGDPYAAVVVEDLGEALAAHHRQVDRAMRPVVDVAQRRAPGRFI